MFLNCGAGVAPQVLMLRVKLKELLVVTLASTNCTSRVRGRNGYRPRSSVNNVHSQVITEVFWNLYSKLN